MNRPVLIYYYLLIAVFSSPLDEPINKVDCGSPGTTFIGRHAHEHDASARWKHESTKNVRKRARDSNHHAPTSPGTHKLRQSRKSCPSQVRFHPRSIKVAVLAGIHISAPETWNRWQRMGNNDERCSMDPPHPSGSRRCTRIETTVRLRAASTTSCTAIPRPHKRSSSSQVRPDDLMLCDYNIYLFCIVIIFIKRTGFCTTCAAWDHQIVSSAFHTTSFLRCTGLRSAVIDTGGVGGYVLCTYQEYFAKLGDYQLCVFDNRCCGKTRCTYVNLRYAASPRLPHDWIEPHLRFISLFSTRLFAEDARDLLDHLGWHDSIHLVGLSMGADHDTHTTRAHTHITPNTTTHHQTPHTHTHTHAHDNRISLTCSMYMLLCRV
jgi:hypothetical protein